MFLRNYQKKIIEDVYAAWQHSQNVLMQLATSGGKTHIFCKIIADHPGNTVVIAHRTEILAQISLTLARHGVKHSLVTQKQTIRDSITLHMQELKKSFYDPRAKVTVIGVDTLIRLPVNTAWFKTISLVVQDEAHHVLKNNKWGTAAQFFPTAKGLYPTATPIRTDGRGLGRHADGLIDHIVLGPSMRWLINQLFLTDYTVFNPPSNLDLSVVPITSTGDYSPPKLRTAVHKSKITGDIVSHYLKLTPGKLGITFAVDIKAAIEIAAEYRANGVPAEVITSKTPDLLRANIMRRFRNKDILQLVNVDILGEGVDVPAVEVISMGRPTQSYSLYVQQFGRALRQLPGKERAVILDHVGNIIRHGLPDSLRRVWTLDRRQKKSSSPDDAIPLKTCLKCFRVYVRTSRACPHCGFKQESASRSTPEQVDGDLCELDSETLAKLRGEINRIDDVPRIPTGLPKAAQIAIIHNHTERQEKQEILRKCIAQWAGVFKAKKLEDSEIYKTFYFNFGIDIATAQTLNSKESIALCDKIRYAIFSNLKKPAE